MKKNLSILTVLILASVFINAQVPTTYRGAFAPAPEKQWTDDWANFDPQNTFYPATNVTVSGNISTNTTWTKDNTYLIQGLVSVDSLVTLTIEPGTVIRGAFNVGQGSALVVRRGAKLIANGTPCNPIVFTSNVAAGNRQGGDWGGVILLGRGLNNLGTQVLIEGIDPVSGVFHGGTIANDNSGSLKYVRIEYPGYAFGSNNEINGLTFGSVGSGTTIDHVQVSYAQDDAFEWFGGSVNGSHLIAYAALDDDWDTDNGFNGLVQFGLSIKDPARSDISTSEGFESDNNSGGTGATPLTSAQFYNITQIGAFRCNSNAGSPVQPTDIEFLRGARLRRNTALRIHNSILMNNFIGLRFESGNAAAEFRNNIIAMDTTISFSAPYTGFAKIAENSASYVYLNSQVPNNTIINNPCDLLVNAWDLSNPDFRPNISGGGSALAGTDLATLFLVQNPLFNANQSTDLGLVMFENGVGSSNGTITLSLPLPSGWDVTIPGLTLSTTPQAGVDGSNSQGAYTNSDWLFSSNGSTITITSKPGVVIGQFGFAQLGLTATRKAGTPGGTNQNLSASLSGGSDVAPENNGTLVSFGAN